MIQTTVSGSGCQGWASRGIVPAPNLAYPHGTTLFRTCTGIARVAKLSNPTNIASFYHSAFKPIHVKQIIEAYPRVNMGGETQIRAMSSSLPKVSAGPVGQQIHSIYKDRLGQFTGSGQYEPENLRGYVKRSGTPNRMLKVELGNSTRDELRGKSA